MTRPADGQVPAPSCRSLGTAIPRPARPQGTRPSPAADAGPDPLPAFPVGVPLDHQVRDLLGDRVLAHRRVLEGAKIADCDVQASDQDQTVRLVREADGEMYSAAPVDLGDPDQATAWADAAGHFGQVDISYNNAGATRVRKHQGPRRQPVNSSP